MAIMHDGYSTIITFALSPGSGGVAFKEITVKPPGLDNGSIDITNMRTPLWRENWPKALRTLTPVTVMVEYDPLFLATISATLLGKNGLVTITYPDASLETLYGFLDKFDPSEHKEGERPTAMMTIQPTNIDPANVLQNPVLHA